MKKTLVVLMAIFFVSIGLNKGYAVTEIKIGHLLPLSGHAAAPIGQEMLAATQLAIKHVNDSGGIKSLGGATIKLVTMDTHGDPQIGMTLTERLINVEKVSAIIGAYQSAVTFPSTAVAEKYKIPWVVDLAAKAEITERGFKYVFRPSQCASAGNADSTIEFLKWIGEKTGKPAKTMAMIYENTDWGQDLAKTLRRRAPEIKVKIILDEPYPPNSANLMPLAVKIKGVNADVVSITGYTVDDIAICQLIERMRIEPMAVIWSGAGSLDQSFIPSIGFRGTNYQYTADGWGGYEACVKTPWAKKVWNDFKQMTGKNMSELSVDAYVAARVLAEALEKAKSTDPEAIRNALSQIKIKGDLADFLGFPIEFNEKGQNPYKKYVTKQIYEGKYQLVWPPYLASRDYKPIWPAPKWDERK
jgi:branched-chain amino acid transport system substrate-binding protein